MLTSVTNFLVWLHFDANRHAVVCIALYDTLIDHLNIKPVRDSSRHCISYKFLSTTRAKGCICYF